MIERYADTTELDEDEGFLLCEEKTYFKIGMILTT